MKRFEREIEELPELTQAEMLALYLKPGGSEELAKRAPRTCSHRGCKNGAYESRVDVSCSVDRDIEVKLSAVCYEHSGKADPHGELLRYLLRQRERGD